MGHYASEVGYEDKFAHLKEKPMHLTDGQVTVNGSVMNGGPTAPKPTKPKPQPSSLSKVLEDAQGIVKAWEAASPAARTLFLTMIEAVKKE